MKAEFDLESLIGTHVIGTLEFPKAFNKQDAVDFIEYLLEDFDFEGWTKSSIPYVIYEENNNEQASA